MRGSVGWYRKDFELPDKRAALEWAVRFESVNYRTARVAQRPRDRPQRRRLHPVRAAPEGPQRKRGVNRLVVRVDSRRLPTDFPPSGLSATGTPTGGWWNYGGIQREVYLAEARHGAVQHRARAARAAPARAARRRSTSRSRWRTSPSAAGAISASAQLRRPRGSGSARARCARGKAELFERPRCGSPSPRLWSPQEPVPVPREDHRRLGRAHGRHATRSRAACARSRSSRGRLYLNGRPVNFRGVGVHEDTAHAGLRGRQRVPRPAGRRGARPSARPCCARTTRCTPTSTSWPTARAC